MSLIEGLNMAYIFTYVQNGYGLECHIEQDTYWRHDKTTNTDYEVSYPVIEAVFFQGVDISPVLGEDLEESILEAFEEESKNEDF